MNGNGACEGAEDLNNCAVDSGCTVSGDYDDSNDCTVDYCVGEQRTKCETTAKTRLIETRITTALQTLAKAAQS